MGYTEATITRARFRMPAESQEAALEGLQAWLREALDFHDDVADLVAGFKLFGIKAVRDDSGDIVDLEFDGVLLAETDDLFAGLAPWVEEGSWVEWQGGNGNVWTYRFENGQMINFDQG